MLGAGRQSAGSQHGRDYSFAAGRLRSLGAPRSTASRVTVWAARGRPRAGLERVLRIARTRLPRLAARFGPYGWPDLQIVVTDDAAMEHTGLIMTPPQDFVVTHELAHEWWYALISDDQAQAPWLDEASPPTPRRRPARSGGRGAGARGRGAGLVTKPRRLLPRRAARRLRLRLHARARACSTCCASGSARARFDAALRDYALAHRYGWSTGAAFRAAMDAASPVPLGDLWRRYRVGLTAATTVAPAGVLIQISPPIASDAGRAEACRAASVASVAPVAGSSAHEPVALPGHRAGATQTDVRAVTSPAPAVPPRSRCQIAAPVARRAAPPRPGA